MRAGLSQSELAESAGLSVAAVAAIEQGLRRYPYAHTLRRLADALRLSEADRAALLASARRDHSAPATTNAPAMSDASIAHAQALPMLSTPLFGRDADVERAVALFSASPPARLLTLTGPGGVGKTRLALAVAHALQSTFAHGAVFVDVSAARTARQVADAIVAGLGLRQSASSSGAELLLAYLRGREVLLALDNFEQALDAAPFIADLLAACPDVRALVTSRAALRLRAEQRFAVEPLMTPPADSGQMPDVVIRYPAAQVFVERARASQPGFHLSVSNAEDVAALCRRLEGLPLALELAAPRLNILTPRALLERLAQPLALLSGGPADLPDRQRTLRATLAWSYDLLALPEQTLFRRLAIFTGGWTLTAAEAICADERLTASATLELLESLMRHSLVQAQRPAGARAGADASADDPDALRFGMLETVREYAAGLLAASGEEEATARRHRDWYLRAVLDIFPRWYDRQRADPLERELDNLRAALRWTIARGDSAAGLLLGVGGWTLWFAYGLYHEGRAWMAELFALPGAQESVGYPYVTALAGHLAYCEGDYTAALTDLTEALTADAQPWPQSTEEYANTQGLALLCYCFLGLTHGARGEMAAAEESYLAALRQPIVRGDLLLTVLNGLAETRFERGDFVGAEETLRRIFALPGIQNYPAALARTVTLQAQLAARHGDYPAAWRLLRETTAALQRHTVWHTLAFVHQTAAEIAVNQDYPAVAAGRLARLLEIAQETGDRHVFAPAIEVFATIIAAREPERALVFVGAATALRESLAVTPTPRERERVERWLPQAMAAHGQEVAAAAIARGRERPLAALAEALASCVAMAATESFPDDHTPSSPSAPQMARD